MSFKNKITRIFLWKNRLTAPQVSENKTERELEEKQETISSLQKLIVKQQEIIKGLGEHRKAAYIPDRQQEETIERLSNEVNRYQGTIKTYEESANKLNAELDEIRLMYQKERVKYQEVANQLEKEREKVSSLERELREFGKGQGVPEELKEEIEKKTALISVYEGQAKTLKNNLEEISNRYQEATEKYEKERQSTIRLEMLILELDKALGLMDIIEKIETKPEEKTGIIVKTR
jgi:chromosome segregation ATPase